MKPDTPEFSCLFRGFLCSCNPSIAIINATQHVIFRNFLYSWLRCLSFQRIHIRSIGPGSQIAVQPHPLPRGIRPQQPTRNPQSADESKTEVGRRSTVSRAWCLPYPPVRECQLPATEQPSNREVLKGRKWPKPAVRFRELKVRFVDWGHGP